MNNIFTALISLVIIVSCILIVLKKNKDTFEDTTNEEDTLTMPSIISSCTIPSDYNYDKYIPKNTSPTEDQREYCRSSSSENSSCKLNLKYPSFDLPLERQEKYEYDRAYNFYHRYKNTVDTAENQMNRTYKDLKQLQNDEASCGETLINPQHTTKCNRGKSNIQSCVNKEHINANYMADNIVCTPNQNDEVDRRCTYGSIFNTVNQNILFDENKTYEEIDRLKEKIQNGRISHLKYSKANEIAQELKSKYDSCKTEEIPKLGSGLNETKCKTLSTMTSGGCNADIMKRRKDAIINSLIKNIIDFIKYNCFCTRCAESIPEDLRSNASNYDLPANFNTGSAVCLNLCSQVELFNHAKNFINRQEDTTVFTSTLKRSIIHTLNNMITGSSYTPPDIQARISELESALPAMTSSSTGNDANVARLQQEITNLQRQLEFQNQQSAPRTQDGVSGQATNNQELQSQFNALIQDFNELIPQTSNNQPGYLYAASTNDGAPLSSTAISSSTFGTEYPTTQVTTGSTGTTGTASIDSASSLTTYNNIDAQGYGMGMMSSGGPGYSSTINEGPNAGAVAPGIVQSDIEGVSNVFAPHIVITNPQPDFGITAFQ